MASMVGWNAVEPLQCMECVLDTTPDLEYGQAEEAPSFQFMQCALDPTLESEFGRVEEDPPGTAVLPTITTLIGLCLAVGHAIVDTGAQHAVIGKDGFDQLVERLAVVGLSLIHI